MNVNRKLAVLVPVFNGGNLLLQSVESCARAEFGRDDYEIFVVDNHSSDGAVDDLPLSDGAGAPIRVFRNERNLGRVENWNRAIDIALESGFEYISFLFAGDCWLPGRALPELLESVRGSHARGGFAPFVVVDDGRRFKYESRRFYVSGDRSVVCTCNEFLTVLLQSGLFPLGPLQANIYRIDADHRPRFDAAQPGRTDVQATLDFLRQCDSKVVISPEPFLEWREHAGRFHSSMGPARTIEDYMETFQSACAQTQLPVDHGRAKAGVVLNSLRLMLKDARPSEWPALLSVIASCAARTPYRTGPSDFVETLWTRFVLGRRLLQFD